MVVLASNEATLGGKGSLRPKALSMMVQRSHIAAVATTPSKIWKLVLLKPLICGRFYVLD